MKYHSPNTDLAALQRELAGNRGSEPVDDDHAEFVEADDGDDDHPDAVEDDDDDGGGWAPRGR